MKTVVFLGTPEFSVPILKGLNGNYDVKLVVTQPDKPVGRKRKLEASPVKQEATKLGIKVLQPKKISNSPEMEEIINLKPDYLITAAYGQFLPDKLLNAAKIAAVNVHGSLLPKYRGGAPIQRSIMNGDKETGISIMYMVKQMDAGNVLSKKAVPIDEKETSGSLFAKLSLVGRDLLLSTLDKLNTGQAHGTEQDEKEATFAPNIKKSEEQLDFNQTAEQINNTVRGLNPDPGAYTLVAGKRLKVWETRPVDAKTQLKPGHVVKKTKKKLEIACGNGTVLELIKVQPAGKKEMAVTNFNNSHQNVKAGDQFID